MPADRSIPIIDLFAGPGGLGEGFSALGRPEGAPRFRIHLSIEKDEIAHRTLELRAFFRQFPHGQAPDDYYLFLQRKLTREELFRAWPAQAEAAARLRYGRRPALFSSGGARKFDASRCSR